MSTALLGYLFLLLPVAAVAWIVWSYRRKAGDKEARSREREAALVGLVQGPRTVPKAGERTVQGSPAAAASMGSGDRGVVATVTSTRRDRFLTQSETLIYYLLRTGMPGYEVFPRVSLTAVVAFPRSVPDRPGNPAPAATHDLDFVVCDKSMRVVAAIQLKGRLGASENAHVERSLATAGVRLLIVDPAAPPRREQLGVLVLGSAG